MKSTAGRSLTLTSLGGNITKKSYLTLFIHCSVSALTAQASQSPTLLTMILKHLFYYMFITGLLHVFLFFIY